MKLTSNVIFWGIAFCFFAAALFFTLKIEKIKKNINKKNPEIQILSGQKVKVSKIIDGDEISVKLEENEWVVRILGISSFEPSVNDPLIENTAKTSFYYLEKLLLNQEVSLIFENFQKDPNNRMLSYVLIDQIDVGYDMILNGLSIVYTKYPFSKMDTYLQAQKSAQKNKKGLWLIPAANNRAIQLQKLWESEQVKEDKKL